MNYIRACLREFQHAIMGVESIKEALQSISMPTIMGVNKANAEFRISPT